MKICCQFHSFFAETHHHRLQLGRRSNPWSLQDRGGFDKEDEEEEEEEEEDDDDDDDDDDDEISDCLNM